MLCMNLYRVPPGDCVSRHCEQGAAALAMFKRQIRSNPVATRHAPSISRPPLHFSVTDDPTENNIRSNRRLV
jgi:hypothetical protein